MSPEQALHFSSMSEQAVHPLPAAFTPKWNSQAVQSPFSQATQLSSRVEHSWHVPETVTPYPLRQLKHPMCEQLRQLISNDVQGMQALASAFKVYPAAH